MKLPEREPLSATEVTTIRTSMREIISDPLARRIPRRLLVTKKREEGSVESPYQPIKNFERELSEHKKTLEKQAENAQQKIQNDVHTSLKRNLVSIREELFESIDTKTNQAILAMNRQINASLSESLNRLENKLSQAISNIQIRQPKDGHTPTKEEIAGVVSEILKKMPKPEIKEGLSLTDEKDKNALLELIRTEAEAIVKNKPTQLGGGGTTYAFHLKDMPNRSKGAGPYYAGNEGKAVVVAPDGKSFTFGEADGAVLTEEIPTGDVDGSNVTYSVVNEPVYIIVDGVQRPKVDDIADLGGGGFTLTGTGPYTITVSALAPPTRFIRSYYNG